MTLTFPAFKLPTLKSMFRAALANPATEATPEHETAYAERAFLREVLAHNPEAIQSDVGLMAMMSQYPRQF
ncbi:hypothetical protein [Sulfitobacter sp. SK011]|uniref:hypothetical protein n=1 Tax=Sulfitobacter sp. SK011 TaxID=1389004 RepID=UPI0013B46138|nr:hypothetical protein [Sulfitobacter sp. SK011]